MISILNDSCYLELKVNKEDFVSINGSSPLITTRHIRYKFGVGGVTMSFVFPLGSVVIAFTICNQSKTRIGKEQPCNKQRK